MSIRHSLAILLIGIALSSGAFAVTDITKRFEINPIRMTYEDLSAIVENMRGLIQNANKETVDGRKEEVSMWISAGEDTLNIQEWETLSKVKSLPKVARSIRFKYRLYEGPVSEVELTLTDTFREVSIRGSDAAQIQAISSYLREQFNQHNTVLGGNFFRLAGAFILFIIGAILLNVRKGQSNSIAPAPVAAGLAIVLSIFVLPWELWFPGIAIYADSASFIDRHANLLSFLSLILALAIPLIQLAYHRIRK